MSTANTPFGIIHFGDECRDDYPNIELYDQPPKGGSPIKLQRPALRALLEAERRLTGKSRRKKFIYVTGSWRSCAYQRELYNRDSDRYAHPNVGVHTRGLAIDVSTAQSLLKRRNIKRILLNLGWKQVRPDDEPWHFSYWVKA